MGHKKIIGLGRTSYKAVVSQEWLRVVTGLKQGSLGTDQTPKENDIWLGRTALV